MKIRSFQPTGKAVPFGSLLFGMLALVLTTLSCRNAEEVTGDPQQQQRRLNDKEAQELLFAKDSLPFWFFNAKVGVDFTSNAKSQSFSATVKMRVDSAFSGTLSVGPVIGGTYLVNRDSVYFTNKQDKCFVKENFSALSEMFGTDIEYSFFQSLVLGLPVGLDKAVKYKNKNTQEYYILSSLKKKKDPRQGNDKDNKDGPKDNNKDDQNDNIHVQYYLNTETLHLDRISIEVPSDGVEIEINYLDRQLHGMFYLPGQTTISIIHPEDSISITLDYGNVKLNEPKEIDINIPESYVQCKKNE